MGGRLNTGRGASPADAAAGVLRSRPGEATHPSLAPPSGVHRLGLAPQRDTLLFVPDRYDSSRPASLIVMLHGAGGVAEHSLGMFQAWADATAALLLSPSSQRVTWDVIRGGYGTDVALLDRALAHVFDRYTIDPARLLIGGFSDGASYALSLGVINGDLWSHIAAFSPGFMAPTSAVGSPRVFISHGTDDTVLPIERCSRRIVPRLREASYDVEYAEFEGGHTVPPPIMQHARTWWGCV